MLDTIAPPSLALLLGCGRDHRRKMHPTEDVPVEVVKLDMSPDVGADIVHDLERHPLPFASESFNELHAYDVLEHIGKQGDWRGFFDEFAEYWRILKPGGRFYIQVPVGASHFADPGHTRFFGPNHFRFLSQRVYEQSERITDYRWYWKLDFEVEYLEQWRDEGATEPHVLAVILRKKISGPSGEPDCSP